MKKKLLSNTAVVLVAIAVFYVVCFVYGVHPIFFLATLGVSLLVSNPFRKTKS